MEKKVATIWFDFTNPPHVNLFRPLIKHFEKEYRIFATARNFVETKKLLENYNIEYYLTGSHAGRNKVKKLYNLVRRNLSLFFNLPSYDLCISSSFEPHQISWLKGKKSIMFDDNETAPNWLYSKFTSYLFSPDCIDKYHWNRIGINDNKIVQYPGFKEDIYIADYVPDQSIMENISFDHYVVVRPENIYASYVPKNTKTIVPELIHQLTEKGYNIVYIPRYAIDKTHVRQNPNVFVPEEPLNGLDLCYFSDAVLTGAGTFAREAALLGVPAVSFFAGDTLLSVDQKLIEQNKIFYSRNIDEIINYLQSSRRIPLNKEKSKVVKDFVIDKIEKIIAS